MAEKNQNIETWQGNDETIEVEILKTDGTPLSLGGARIDWVVKKKPDALDTTALIAKTTAVPGEIAIIDPVNGIIRIYLEETDTKNLEPYKYYHEGRVYLTTGEYKTVFIGDFKLNPTAHYLYDPFA